MNQEQYEIEMEEIKKNPYDYIKKYYEELYPHVGGRVMGVCSLVLPSLVTPPFLDKNGKKTTARINYLLLAPPSTAKTSISDHIKKLALNPFPFEYITDAGLSATLDDKEYVTVITSDISRIFRDIFLMKLVENIIGDEGCLSRFTKKSKSMKEKKINAVAYFAGTPINPNQQHTLTNNRKTALHQGRLISQRFPCDN